MSWSQNKQVNINLYLLTEYVAIVAAWVLKFH